MLDEECLSDEPLIFPSCRGAHHFRLRGLREARDCWLKSLPKLFRKKDSSNEPTLSKLLGKS